jgi:porphobilinogen synthase
MGFPQLRLRRLRSHPALRRMVRETRLSVDQLIYPLFVRPGSGVRQPIGSMPGQFQLSVDTLVEECRRAQGLGIPAVLLFGIPESKDAVGSGAYAEHGIVQRACEAIKKACPDLLVVTDVCLCEYTDHGHCGVVVERGGRRDVDNDATLPLLVKEAVSHARAGADIIAPSDMMDGRVGAIRAGLDEAGFANLPILAYAAKYASSYYGPFRDAAESPPKFGDRRSYQMDPANGDEALREVAADIAEGADMVMVKPALNYLDILWRVKQEFGLPTAAYHVSGEYSMIKAAAANGWLDEKGAALEATTAIVRAGADMVLTYFAPQLAEWLAGK